MRLIGLLSSNPESELDPEPEPDFSDLGPDSTWQIERSLQGLPVLQHLHEVEQDVLGRWKPAANPLVVEGASVDHSAAAAVYGAALREAVMERPLGLKGLALFGVGPTCPLL